MPLVKGVLNPGAILRKKMARANKARVESFFLQYPFMTQADCATFIGLNEATVQRHYSALKKEYFTRFKVELLEMHR